MPAFAWQQQVVSTREQSFSKAVAMDSAGKLKTIKDGMRKEVAQLDGIAVTKRNNIRNQIQTRMVQSTLASVVAGIFGMGGRSAWPTGCRVSPLRHQRRERRSAGGQTRRRTQQPRKNCVPRQYEPRNPHAHECHSRLQRLVTPGRSADPPPKHRQYLQSIRSSANSLLLLINDILDMSKIEAGVMELHPEPTDLREICDFIHTLFSEPAARKSLKLECHVAENLSHTPS